MTYFKYCQYDALSWRPLEHVSYETQDGVPICQCGIRGFEHLREYQAREGA
jgi:hypothetical protein